MRRRRKLKKNPSATPFGVIGALAIAAGAYLAIWGERAPLGTLVAGSGVALILWKG